MTRKLSLKGAWGELDSRKAFPGTMTRGVSYTGPSFRVGWRAAGGGGGGNFYFSGVFFWYWLSFYFVGVAGYWAIILWGLVSFLIFPNLRGS